MTKKGLAWIEFVVFTAGLVITVPMWILGWIDDRAMIGMTLALSWLAPVVESVTQIFFADDG